MVGDSLGLVLVLPVKKDARRAGEMDQIAFEIDVLRSGQKPFDMLHRILPSFQERLIFRLKGLCCYSLPTHRIE